VVGRLPNTPAAFTLGEIPGLTSGHMDLSGEPRKKSPVIPPQCLNHYATPDVDLLLLNLIP